jgi:hypothetical protein
MWSQQYSMRHISKRAKQYSNLYRLVYFELKSDSFQRYLHSELFQTFQKNRLSSEASLVTEQNKQDRKLSDFSHPRITDEDIATFSNLVCDANSFTKV